MNVALALFAGLSFFGNVVLAGALFLTWGLA